MRSLLHLVTVCVVVLVAPLAGAGVDEPSEPAKAAPPNPAKANYWQALIRFRSDTKADLTAGRAALDAAAAGEFTPAQMLLGECYQAGAYGYSKNARKAAAQFRLAAERGNAFAELKYGACLLAGAGVSRDYAAAGKWLRAALSPTADYPRPLPPPDFPLAGPAAAEAEVQIAGLAAANPVAGARAQAHYLLAVLLTVEKNQSEAQEHYVAAATAGPAGRDGIQAAAVQAAINYAFGNGVPRDADKANAMLDQSRKLARRSGAWMLHNFAAAKLVDDFAVAQLEDSVAGKVDDETIDAQVQIAREFTDRKSKNYNPREAAKWYELAAESGRTWAMLNLAFLCASGDLGPPELEKAFTWFERAGDGEAPKHFLATGNLVICLTNGLGTKPDPTRALALARLHRDDSFICYLATIGQCPKGVLTYEQEVELTRTWAEQKQDAQAQAFFADRYWHGWGVPANTGKGEKWYKEAAERGNGMACRNLGEVEEDRDHLSRAVELYRRGAEAGDLKARANLAYMYSVGRGVAVDELKAKELYEECIKLRPNFGRALNNLGVYYHDQFLEAKKAADQTAASAAIAKAVEFYEAADRAGYELGAQNLGYVYYLGEPEGKPDYEKAYVYFEKVAEGHGNQIARVKLADMLEQGLGVPVSMTEAAYYLRLAALDGDNAALVRLIDYYVEGKGGAQDFERALFWLQRLARTGNPGALMSAADVLLQMKRYDDAVELLEVLRDADDKRIAGFAYERLSRCYRDGLGGRVKPEKAQRYLEQAVELGNGDALLRMAVSALAMGKEAAAIALFKDAAKDTPAADLALGQMCYFGQHMPKDVPQAIVYLRKAAEGKNRDALYFLAGMTATHAEGAPTLDEAIRFAQAAEGLGHPKAAVVRERLERMRQQLSSPSEQTTGAHST